MKKTFFFIAFFSFVTVSSCFSNTFDKLITEKDTAGALENFAILDVEIQTRKLVNSGPNVQVMVPCPYDVKREQLRPTILAAIKAVKKAYPNCEWISVFAEVAKGWYPARAEYTSGKVEITYNIMTDEAFSAFNKDWVKSGNPPVKKPTQEEFLRATAVDNMWQKVHYDLLDPKKQATSPNDIEEKIAALTASRLQMDVQDVIKTRRLLMYYKTSNDMETITAKP